MKKYTQITILTLIFLFLSAKPFAQSEATLRLCENSIVYPYISDGQEYRAILNEEEIAEFRVTFYGNTTYRIAACSGKIEGNLIFSVYDKERNELFSNRDYDNSPYWDLEFTNTMDCIIEAQLDSEISNSGFAMLLIGFKQ